MNVRRVLRVAIVMLLPVLLTGCATEMQEVTVASVEIIPNGFQGTATIVTLDDGRVLEGHGVFAPGETAWVVEYTEGPDLVFAEKPDGIKEADDE